MGMVSVATRLFSDDQLDQLRSFPDIGHHQLGARLQIGSTVYDPADPFGKMFFNILASFAEFEVDIIRLRTIEGMARARQRGRLKGRQPKLSGQQRAHLRQFDREGTKTPTELAELFGVSRATIYRELKKAQEAAA